MTKTRLPQGQVASQLQHTAIKRQQNTSSLVGNPEPPISLLGTQANALQETKGATPKRPRNSTWKNSTRRRNRTPVGRECVARIWHDEWFLEGGVHVYMHEKEGGYAGPATQSHRFACCALPQKIREEVQSENGIASKGAISIEIASKDKEDPGT